MVILTLRNRYTFFLTERHYSTVISCQKIASSNNTNINGVYMFYLMFYAKEVDLGT